MSVLMIAEHDNAQLNIATLHAITAATQLGEVDVLVAGFHAERVLEQLQKIKGLRKIWYADAEHYAHGLAEEIAPLVVLLAADYRYIVAAASVAGKNIAPRVAALLDCSQVSDLIEIIDKNTFVRPIYAGNALLTLKGEEEKWVLTFRTTAFDVASVGDGVAEVEKIAPTPAQNLSRFISQEKIETERSELTQARVIVSGGRALGSAAQFHQILTPLADTLNAAIGASRAAVDAEYAPNDYQVGQTGKIVAPDVYFAIGISGAIQHVAGIQDSKMIVAINKDPDAPIFQVADVGIVGDLFEIVPQLNEALQSK